MPNLTTTFEKIRSYDPCESGWEKLLENLKPESMEQEVTLSQILDSNGVQDAYWALLCWDYKDYCLLLADVAETVLDVFEERNPGDERPRKCIETVRLYAANQATKEELDAACAAAYAASYAAAWGAAGAAANAASYAAAWDTAWNAAWKKFEQMMVDWIKS